MRSPRHIPHRAPDPGTPHGSPVMLSSPGLARCYTQLLRIRRVEEEIIRALPHGQDQEPGPSVHRQEAVSVGVCDALTPRTWCSPPIAATPLYLAKGGDLQAHDRRALRQGDRLRGGKAGSMHLIDTAVNMMGTSAVVATASPNAVGDALALKMRRRSRDRGLLLRRRRDRRRRVQREHQLRRRCRSCRSCSSARTTITRSTHTSARRLGGARLCERAAPYGIPAREDSGDILRCMRRRARRSPRCRAGGGARASSNAGPTAGATMSAPSEDSHHGYRCDAELAPWIAERPVKSVGAHADRRAARGIDDAVERRDRRSHRLRRSKPVPRPTRKFYDHVFAAQREPHAASPMPRRCCEATRRRCGATPSVVRDGPGRRRSARHVRHDARPA